MNALRRILVHVDSTDSSPNRLRQASVLAAWMGAQLQAIYAVSPWLWLYPTAQEMQTDPTAQLSEQDRQRLVKAKAQFDGVNADLAVTASWDALTTPSPYEIAKLATYADLLVLGPSHQTGAKLPADASTDVPADFVASVTIDSGRPILLMPSTATAVTAGAKLLLAWNGSREAARAVAAAWPWLSQASEVHIAVWQDEPASPQDAGAQLQAYLQLHGVQAQVHRAPSSGAEVGTAMLALADSLHVGMLVMGCYGHSRAREWALGGATRSVLSHARLPVLLVH